MRRPLPLTAATLVAALAVAGCGGDDGGGTDDTVPSTVEVENPDATTGTPTSGPGVDDEGYLENPTPTSGDDDPEAPTPDADNIPEGFTDDGAG